MAGFQKGNNSKLGGHGLLRDLQFFRSRGTEITLHVFLAPDGPWRVRFERLGRISDPAISRLTLSKQRIGIVAVRRGIREVQVSWVSLTLRATSSLSAALNR